jgi:hypothetical protein
MGRPSKAKAARVKNLQEAKARQKASVEDVKYCNGRPRFCAKYNPKRHLILRRWS